MEHKEILKKHIGGRVDADKAYGYQCVDWVRMYTIYKGQKISSRGSAIELWNKGLGEGWKKVKKTAFNYPSEGDIVLWGETWGKGYGHIAVANGLCNPLILRTTDQNAGSGNGDGLGGNSISPFFRSYSGVVGWFKYIGS